MTEIDNRIKESSSFNTPKTQNRSIASTSTTESDTEPIENTKPIIALSFWVYILKIKYFVFNIIALYI